MRVALWADNVLDPNRSGMGYYQTQLLHALDRLSNGHEYTVFYTPRRLGQSFPLDFDTIRTRGLPGVRHLYYPAWHLLKWPSIDAFLPKVDLVHLLHVSVTVPTRHPRIVSVVDLASARLPGQFPNRRRMFKDTALRRAVLDPAVTFVAISEFVKRDFCDLYEVDEARVVSVPLGVDRDHFHPVWDEIALTKVRERYALPRDFILFVGVLNPRKNVETLIRGVALFNHRMGASFLLVLAGAPGWQYESIYTAAERAGCVRFVGYVADDDLPAVYSLSQALVLPSSYEGFGLPLVEAMACGVPVVASNLTAIPEVVGDGGLLLDEITPEAIAAALERVVSDRAYRRALVQRGLARAASFSWDEAARRNQSLYSRVAGLA